MSEKKGFFQRLKEGLSKTKEAFSESIDNVFKAFVKVDEELFEQLEEALVEADIGAVTAMELTDQLRDRVKSKRITDGNEVKSELCALIGEMLGDEHEGLNLSGLRQRIHSARLQLNSFVYGQTEQERISSKVPKVLTLLRLYLMPVRRQRSVAQMC